MLLRTLLGSLVVPNTDLREQVRPGHCLYVYVSVGDAFSSQGDMIYSGSLSELVAELGPAHPSLTPGPVFSPLGLYRPCPASTFFLKMEY